MPFTPKLHPGRQDRMGTITVPNDIFKHVTKNAGWSTSIETHSPSSRQTLLLSLKYWIDTNGMCVIRNASTGKFALMKDINACATILPGNVVYKPTFAAFTIAANPTSGTSPTVVNLTITSDVASNFRVDFGDGTVTDYASTDAISHSYTTGTHTLYVTQLDRGEPLGEAKTQTITITAAV